MVCAACEGEYCGFSSAVSSCDCGNWVLERDIQRVKSAQRAFPQNDSPQQQVRVVIRETLSKLFVSLTLAVLHDACPEEDVEEVAAMLVNCP